MKRKLFVVFSLMWGALSNLSQAKEIGFCAAIRGNGELAMAHFPALARLVESYGPLQGAAGGSSATISIFIAQNMSKNELLTHCDQKSDECTAQKSLELALLLKSVEGYVMYESKSKEAQTFSHILSSNLLNHFDALYKKMSLPIEDKNSLEHQQFEAELHTTIHNFLLEVENIVSSKRLRSLINVDALQFFKESLTNQNLTKHERNLQIKFRLKELIDSIKMIGKFNARDKNLFLRLGIISFEGLAKISGELADFYAGYLPQAQQSSISGTSYKSFFTKFLSCATAAKGETWQHIMTQNVPGEESLSCGNAFFAALTYYKSAHASFAPHSTEEMISTSSFPVLISTGLLTNEAIAQYKISKDSYDAYIPGVNEIIPFHPHWDDIKFGYFGKSSILDHVSMSLPSDEKSHKFFTLGDSVWKDILAISPAEPGLAPAKAIPGFSADHLVSIGGWSDLHPVLVLKALPSCERVVYITRKGGETKFGQGVATQLGLENWVWEKVLTPDTHGKYPQNDFGIPGETESHWGHLYNLANPQSSFSTSLKRADAVYCTNWDSYSVGQSLDLMKHCYLNSPLFVQSQPYLDDQWQQRFFDSDYFLTQGNKPAGLSPMGDDPQLEKPYIHADQWQDYPGCILMP